MSQSASAAPTSPQGISGEAAHLTAVGMGDPSSIEWRGWACSQGSPSATRHGAEGETEAHGGPRIICCVGGRAQVSHYFRLSDDACFSPEEAQCRATHRRELSPLQPRHLNQEMPPLPFPRNQLSACLWTSVLQGALETQLLPFSQETSVSSCLFPSPL